MDEPTNNLDAELLEEFLLNYEATLFPVIRDCAFLDDVVTSCLVYEGNDMVKEHVGGYSDWLYRPARNRCQ